jgi:hypothetical protein
LEREVQNLRGEKALQQRIDRQHAFAGLISPCRSSPFAGSRKRETQAERLSIEVGEIVEQFSQYEVKIVEETEIQSREKSAQYEEVISDAEVAAALAETDAIFAGVVPPSRSNSRRSAVVLRTVVWNQSKSVSPSEGR